MRINRLIPTRSRKIGETFHNWDTWFRGSVTTGTVLLRRKGKVDSSLWPVYSLLRGRKALRRMLYLCEWIFTQATSKHNHKIRYWRYTNYSQISLRCHYFSLRIVPQSFAMKSFIFQRHRELRQLEKKSIHFQLDTLNRARELYASITLHRLTLENGKLCSPWNSKQTLHRGVLYFLNIIRFHYIRVYGISFKSLRKIRLSTRRFSRKSPPLDTAFNTPIFTKITTTQ